MGYANTTDIGGGGGLYIVLKFSFQDLPPPTPPMMLCKFVTLPLTQSAFKLVTCIVSDHRSSGCQKWFRTSFLADERQTMTSYFGTLNGILILVSSRYLCPTSSLCLLEVCARFPDEAGVPVPLFLRGDRDGRTHVPGGGHPHVYW